MSAFPLLQQLRRLHHLILVLAADDQDHQLRDNLASVLDWATGGEPPIVLCERCESGFGFAPHFRGIMYRKALEEFAGWGGPDSAKGLERLRHVVAIIASHLPEAWARQLQHLAGRDFGQWHGPRGEIFQLAKDELEAAIAANLAFEHLNEKFIQDKELAKRARP